MENNSSIWAPKRIYTFLKTKILNLLFQSKCFVTLFVIYNDSSFDHKPIIVVLLATSYMTSFNKHNVIALDIWDP